MRLLILVTIIVSNTFIVCSQSSSEIGFNIEKEMTKNLNGTFVDSLNAIKWTPYPKEVIAISEDGYAYTSIDSVISYTSNSENYKLVVLSTNQVYEGLNSECAGCAPSLGLALYKLVDGKYVLSSFNRSIRQMGQAGHIPPYSIVDISENSKGFLISEDNFMDNDVYTYLFSLYESDVSALTFEFPNFQMTDRASSKYKTSTISFNKTKEDDEFYTIQLNVSSFKMDKKLGSESILYSFNGRKWEPIK